MKYKEGKQNLQSRPKSDLVTGSCASSIIAEEKGKDSWNTVGHVFSILFPPKLCIQKVKVKMKSLSRARLFVTPWTVAYQAPPSMEFTRLLHPWNFPGKSTGAACHFLLQGIFLTQGSNPGLVHCRQMLYRLSHQASPCTQKTHNIC